MMIRTKTVLITLAVIVAVSAVVTVAWALTAQKKQQFPDHTDVHVEAIDPVAVDPELAARAAMVGLYSWEPAQQSSPQDAAAGIADQLTGTLEDYARSNTPDPVIPDLWETWAKTGDRLHAVSMIGEGGIVHHDPDTATVDVIVEQSVWHPNGDLTPYSRFNADVEIVLIDGTWKAENYLVTSVDY